jgi:DNA-binding NtrC family response regulator
MHTVLLVDDDRDVLETLEAVLVQAGNRVIGVNDAQAALSVLADGVQVDVIVTDYKLPHMDGMEFLGRLREISPDTPVIVLTGYGSVDSYLRFINLGAYEFMNKPVLSKELQRVVRAAILSNGPDRGKEGALYSGGSGSGTGES